MIRKRWLKSETEQLKNAVKLKVKKKKSLALTCEPI